ncbi:MAG: hypothetical protein ACJ741_06245, partial [Pyrinomonadaceae bacterium]
MLAPSTRTADLVAGRRALLDGADLRGPPAKPGLTGATGGRASRRSGEGGVIALGPALPVSRRSRIGVPVGVRANLALALQRGRFDIVHGFEP